MAGRKREWALGRVSQFPCHPNASHLWKLPPSPSVPKPSSWGPSPYYLGLWKLHFIKLQLSKLECCWILERTWLKLRCLGFISRHSDSWVCDGPIICFASKLLSDTEAAGPCSSHPHARSVVASGHFASMYRFNSDCICNYSLFIAVCGVFDISFFF